MYDHEEEYRGYTIYWGVDNEFRNSTKCLTWSNLACYHPKYNLCNDIDMIPDKNHTWKDIYNYIVNKLCAAVICDLQLDDHYGTHLKVGRVYDLTSPDTRFENASMSYKDGFIGFAFVTEDYIKRMCGINEITDEHRRLAKNAMVAEIENYAYYLNDEVFGFVVFDPDEEAILRDDGFYGPFEVENMLEHARNMIDESITRIIDGTKTQLGWH